MRFMLAAVAAALLASSVGCQAMKSSGCGDACGGGSMPCHLMQPRLGCAPQCCGDCGGNGCNQCNQCKEGCLSNALAGMAADPSCCPCGPGDSVYDFQPGPPTGAVAYPYYTTRGPRDFLMANPPSIGPGGAYGCR